MSDIDSKYNNLILRSVERHGTPQFKYRFGVELPKLPKTGDSVKLIQDRITSVSPVLDVVNEIKNAPDKNSHWYFFNDDDVSPFTITLLEWQDFLCIKYFLEWNSLMVNDDGTYNVPTYYKKNIKVNLLSPDDKPLFSINHIGCFPNKKSIAEVNYESSDPVSIDIEITYDSFEIL